MSTQTDLFTLKSRSSSSLYRPNTKWIKLSSAAPFSPRPKSAVFRQFHSLFQSRFCRECELVLPLSIYRILSVPTQGVKSSVSLPSFYRSQYIPRLFITLHFPHERSNRSSTSFSSTTFLNFRGISDLLSEVSKFQHRTKLYSKSNTLLVSSLNVSPIFW
jgi:hypothetical protein